MKCRTLMIAASVLFSAAALAEENPAIEYRQSLMSLIGSNYGPMSMSVDGDIAWDDARIAGWGKDLKALSQLNAMRGFAEGSEGGNAKPGIWTNMDDFRKKMEAMELEAAKLGDVAQGGDRKAITEQIAATGKACKSCHDDYKKKH
jgi:cytochrome c556